VPPDDDHVLAQERETEDEQQVAALGERGGVVGGAEDGKADADEDGNKP
jgi:hypothetical protein